MMAEVTRILTAFEAGDPHAAEQLLPLVYDELRGVARALLAGEKPGQTLEATALVHEAYLRLKKAAPSDSALVACDFANRRHFFASAAEAMRRILVDNARRKLTNKHGGGRQRVPLDETHRITQLPDGLLALDEALGRLAEEEPAKAELVRLRFFAGLSTAEAAGILNISVPTAERWWSFARTWLYAELADPTEKPDGP